MLGTVVYVASTGTHTMRIQVREDGLSLDQVVLSPATYLTSAPGATKNDGTILTGGGGGDTSSGDTGGAVAHAFHAVPYTRVVVLYPDGRISPTQEAQLTVFNDETGADGINGGNVRAYAVAGSFDDCHRLTREAFGDGDLRLRHASVDCRHSTRLAPSCQRSGSASFSAPTIRL